MSEGETETRRERVMCFPYIKKRNFVAKTRSTRILFNVFICLASVFVGFDYFSVVRPLK